jgi:hypothetical protein
MNMQQLRRRQAARQLEHSRIWAPDRFDVRYSDRDEEDNYFHDDDGEVRNVTCKHCHGTGGDPWNDGILPCEHCDGEGYEWWK